MVKTYQIDFYKHYWPVGGIAEYDIPMPYRKDERKYTIEAKSEKEAVKLAEKEYGGGERLDSTGKYIENPDGSWTVMNIIGANLTQQEDI